MKKGCMGDFC